MIIIPEGFRSIVCQVVCLQEAFYFSIYRRKVLQLTHSRKNDRSRKVGFVCVQKEKVASSSYGMVCLCGHSNLTKPLIYGSDNITTLREHSQHSYT